MKLCSILSMDRKAYAKNLFVMLNLLFWIGIAATNGSAITAQEVMENALEVYESIDNYKAVVQTYQSDSMHASSSIFDSQQPIISYNLFFRKPDAHAVEQIGKSRHGIFRLELLSAIGKLKDKTLELKKQELLLGQRCYVLECTSAEEPDTVVRLWVSRRNWTVQQFTLTIKTLALVTTQFKYPPGGNRRVRFLPIETRSFFPLSKKVLINRITNYEVNTNLSSTIFEKRQNKEQTK